jgi:hypothetical protein
MMLSKPNVHIKPIKVFNQFSKYDQRGNIRFNNDTQLQ